MHINHIHEQECNTFKFTKLAQKTKKKRYLRKFYTGIPGINCNSLYWGSQILQFLLNWRFVTTLYQAYRCHVSNSIYLFMSLCHILVILTVFQVFPLVLYLLWWSVISDLWCYYFNWWFLVGFCLFYCFVFWAEKGLFQGHAGKQVPHAPQNSFVLFQIKICTVSWTCTLNQLNRVQTIFICTSKSKNLCDSPIWFLVFFFSFLAAQQHMEFPSQGLDPSHSCDACCSCGNAGSLTHCAWPGTEPASQCSRDTTSPIVLQGNSWLIYLEYSFYCSSLESNTQYLQSTPVHKNSSIQWLLPLVFDFSIVKM